MSKQSEAWLYQQAIQARCFHPSGQWEEFPRAALEGSLVARFEAMVTRYPDHLAIKCDDRSQTYRELNRAANQVAHAILQVTPAPPKFVALLFEHDIAAIVALLAVLKVGAAYLPLDPTFPLARNQFMLADAQTTLLVTNRRNWALAATLTNGQQRLLNSDEAAAQSLDENPGKSVSPDALCQLLYTSGSTGQPKGVLQNHRNLLHCVLQNSNHLHICAEDRHPLFGSYSTHAGAYSIFCTLLNGAALFPYALQERGVHNLAQWLNQEAITLCDLVPTAFRQIVNDPSNTQGFPHVRVLYLGGERVGPHDVAAYKHYLEPTAILATGLAATETCSEVCRLLIDQESTVPARNVPLGYPLPGMEIVVLDEAGQPVGPNQIGEIAVRSAYLALGYWQRPELTAARFHADPSDPQQRIYLTGDLGLINEDGALIHMGRKDFQLKIRGNRVDSGEVESALLALAWVQQAAVIGVPGPTGEATLIAYLVLQEDQPLPETPTISQLRKALADQLPSYMIPAQFVFLPTLPLTATGKIDRTALPAAPTTRPVLDAVYRTPRTPIEQQLVTIWGDVLAMSTVGIDDPFPELGGNSLQAMRIAARVNEVFGVEIAPANFFTAATVAVMAHLVATVVATQLDRDRLDVLFGLVENVSDAEAAQLVRTTHGTAIP